MRRRNIGHVRGPLDMRLPSRTVAIRRDGSYCFLLPPRARAGAHLQ